MYSLCCFVLFRFFLPASQLYNHLSIYIKILIIPEFLTFFFFFFFFFKFFLEKIILFFCFFCCCCFSLCCPRVLVLVQLSSCDEIFFVQTTVYHDSANIGYLC